MIPLFTRCLPSFRTLLAFGALVGGVLPGTGQVTDGKKNDVTISDSGTNYTVTHTDEGNLTAEAYLAASRVSTWTSRTAPSGGTATEWYGICWSPTLGIFVAVGDTGTNRVMTSPDGITWTARNASAARIWSSVCWSPKLSLFVAVANGSSSNCMTSPDGITWTTRTTPATTGWSGVTWSPELSLFCAVGTGGTNQIATSPDGINWTARTPADTGQFAMVVWAPELNLLCAITGTGASYRVQTSPDGITWTGRTAAEANEWSGLAWSPRLGLFAAVSNNGTNRVMTSPDGITWTSRSASAANAWYGVTWCPQLNLFVATASSGTNRVMTSPDGITWTGRAESETAGWYRSAWSPALGIAVAIAYSGTNRIMTSTPLVGIGAAGPATYTPGLDIASTDTTLTRGAAGQAQVEGNNLFTATKTTADALQAANLVTLTSSSTDTYAGTAGVTITSYVTGTHYTFTANTANTGAASLNINGLGAKTIVKVAGGVTTTLANNDILSGQVVDVVYDGTNLQIQSTLGNPASDGSYVYTLTGGFTDDGTVPTNATRYFGMGIATSQGSTSGTYRVPVPISGTVIGVDVVMACTGTAGSGEAWEMFLRDDSANEVSVQSITVANAQRRWSNYGLSFGVTAGDWLEIKSATPNFATPPTAAKCMVVFTIRVTP